jgi:DNA polymerase V
MIDPGIHPGDILVVDHALEPTNGRVVIAVIDGEMTVKRIAQRRGRLLLLADNSRYTPPKSRRRWSSKSGA